VQHTSKRCHELGSSYQPFHCLYLPDYTEIRIGVDPARIDAHNRVRGLGNIAVVPSPIVTKPLDLKKTTGEPD
jgi:hypothetical protein